MKGVWKKRNFLSTYPSLHCTNNLSVDVQSQKNVQAQIPYTSGPTLCLLLTKIQYYSHHLWIFQNNTGTLGIMQNTVYLICKGQNRKSQNMEFLLKIVSMIRKYHNHKPQTIPWHRKEEPHNHHETPGRRTKQSNQLSLPHQDDFKTKMDIK